MKQDINTVKLQLSTLYGRFAGNPIQPRGATHQYSVKNQYIDTDSCILIPSVLRPNKMKEGEE